ncbi:MAG: phosphatase PAP2 family protein [Candidatus Bathyarchaeales archaeon]
MENPCSKRRCVVTAVYVVVTLLIGLAAAFLPLNQAECGFIAYLQALAQKNLGITFFKVLTYLGDLYVWVIFTLIYFFYSYFKSRKHFNSAVELATFLITVSIFAYIFKEMFARPRPHCPNVTAYEQEADFSYPSGHVSRATGAFAILSGKNRTTKTLTVIAIFLLSTSRIVLGAHYLTDIIGAVFLSLAAQNIANIAVSFLRLPERFPH